jgi:hypothetical protein
VKPDLKDYMGQFHERKLLTVLALGGFGFALLQAGTNALQAMMISAVTVLTVIIGDIYYCGKRNGDGYAVNQHIRRLGFLGGIATIAYLVLLVPFIMFLIGGIILISVGYQIFQKQRITEDELIENSTSLIAAILFFAVYVAPALFIIPILIIYLKFLEEEWPEEVNL